MAPEAVADLPVTKTQWVCTVCGYVYEGAELPAGYTCPLCGVGVDQFEKRSK
ncbi:rubredoxin-like domain-containing protein [uncultured Allofournierella sp.]|uniref:rubredoxin-like domain-containing protein n=1 Tax=uncultured Allofournierella sp. TaxID=1940258 RepID=UPI003425C261